jgi:hypothetical protein
MKISFCRPTISTIVFYVVAALVTMIAGFACGAYGTFKVMR